MSEKKTLHNVWLIQDKVPIDESADNVPVDDPDDSGQALRQLSADAAEKGRHHFPFCNRFQRK